MKFSDRHETGTSPDRWCARAGCAPAPNGQEERQECLRVRTKSRTLKERSGKECDLKNPAHYPNAPDRHRQAKTTGLVRAANGAGRRQAAPVASMKSQFALITENPIYAEI